VDARIGVTTCFVVTGIEIKSRFSVKFKLEKNPLEIKKVSSEDILNALGVPTGPPDPEQTLIDQVIENLEEALQNATDIPVSLTQFVRLMLPSATAASALVEWIRFEIVAIAVGTFYKWDQPNALVPPTWHEAPLGAPIEEKLVEKQKDFPLLMHVLFNLDDSRTFVSATQQLFQDIATSLTTTPVDPVAKLTPIINSRADVVVWAMGE